MAFTKLNAAGSQNSTPDASKVKTNITVQRNWQKFIEIYLVKKKCQ
jgi:hypothetical protein